MLASGGKPLPTLSHSTLVSGGSLLPTSFGTWLGDRQEGRLQLEGAQAEGAQWSPLGSWQALHCGRGPRPAEPSEDSGLPLPLLPVAFCSRPSPPSGSRSGPPARAGAALCSSSSPCPQAALVALRHPYQPPVPPAHQPLCGGPGKRLSGEVAAGPPSPENQF